VLLGECKLRLVWRVAGMRETRSAYRVLMKKLGSLRFGRRIRWEGNINRYRNVLHCDNGRWKKLVQNRDQFYASVVAALILGFCPVVGFLPYQNSKQILCYVLIQSACLFLLILTNLSFRYILA
jgi:hypothetical protein